MVLVAAFYKFASLPDFADLRGPLLALCHDRNVRGTILLAEEGVNGTIAGASGDVHAVLAHLRADRRLADLEHKESHAETQPFRKIKVRLKREIVTLGVPGLDPNQTVGTYVAPEAWNDLISDPDVVVIDARNDYETAIGTFEGAIDPQTERFRDLPAWLDAQRGAGGQAPRRDVLHGRDPVREVHGAAARQRLRGRLPPEGRHSQVPRNGPQGREPLGGASASSSTSA